MKAVPAVVGGDHGNTAFQFGAAITADLHNREWIYFELISCKLICREDISIGKNMLTRLTTGLKIIATKSLHLYVDANNSLQCSFTPPSIIEQITTLHVSVYVTGDLAFQAMILGRESMSGAHCMMCMLKNSEFDRPMSGLPWKFQYIIEAGKKAEEKGRSINGVKQAPWWPFLKFENHMVPLLHCMIGIGNNLLDRFCDVIKEFFEAMSTEEVNMKRALTISDSIVIETVKQRDNFEKTDEGKKVKLLQRSIAICRRKIKKFKEVESGNCDDLPPPNDTAVLTREITAMEDELKPLLNERNKIAEKLVQTRRIISATNNNLRDVQTSKAKSSDSLETKLFCLLKEVGVELTRYYGGSLNGKDVKKVMNNATFHF